MSNSSPLYSSQAPSGWRGPPRGRGHKRAPNKDALMAADRYYRAAIHLALSKAAPPSAYDSWEKGLCPPIQDQGQCGSCWRFSGVRVANTAMIVAGLAKPTQAYALSEETLLDGCGGGESGGCDGDDNTTSLAYSQSVGEVLKSAYPYTAGDGSTARCLSSYSSMPLAKITSWGFADPAAQQDVGDPLLIQAAIMSYGGVGCAVAADDVFESWGDNNPSLDAPFTGSGSTSIDHDVFLSGWRNTGTKTTSSPIGASETPSGYWLMDNSWGMGWGVGGRMAIDYGANLIGTEPVYAVATPVPIAVSDLVALGSKTPWPLDTFALLGPLTQGVDDINRSMQLPVSTNAFACVLTLLGALASGQDFATALTAFAGCLSAPTCGKAPRR